MLSLVCRYHDWIQLALTAGDGSASQLEQLASLRDQLAETVARVSDIAAAHLFAFHSQFGVGSEVLLALPTASPARAPVRAQLGAAVEGVTVAGFPTSVYLFSDVLVCGANNPALGPSEAVLLVYPVGNATKIDLEIQSITVRGTGDTALELFPADEQQARQIGLDLAVAVALRPVVSVALPHSEPPVLPTPARMVGQPSQEGSCMLVEYSLLGNLAQFDNAAFGAAYAVEIGVDADSVQLVAVRAADRVVQLCVHLQHTEHRDATVSAPQMGCRLIGWSQVGLG